MAAEPGTRVGVHHICSVRDELVHGRPHVGHGKADVMHPRTAARDEAPHVSVLAQGGNELDTPATDAEIDRLDALFVEPPSQLHFSAEERSIRLHRLFEVFDREGDVVHGTDVHAADPSGWAECQSGG